MTSTKALLNSIAALCIGAVGIALVSQHVFDMAPCAWCVMQRLVYLVIALICWIGVAGPPNLARAAALLAAALGIAGAIAAWYQYSVASTMFSCAQTFADRFMVQSGLDAGLPWLFGIYATCMDARISLLGVEYAILSLILFVVLTLLALRAATAKK